MQQRLETREAPVRKKNQRLGKPPKPLSEPSTVNVPGKRHKITAFPRPVNV